MVSTKSVTTPKKKKTGVFLSVPAKFSRLVGQVDYGPVLRQEVIDRWRYCGFDVLSVNSQEESSQLAALVNNIEIIPVDDKGRVRIASIVKCAVDRNIDIAIIANADCIPIDVKLMPEIVSGIDADEVCLLSRSNIPPDTLMATREPFPGFDVFILGSGTFANIPENSNWRIGDTCWDYWFPLLHIAKGAKISRCGFHSLLHLDHPSQWNEGLWLENAHKLFEEFPVGSTVHGGAFNRRFRNHVGLKLTDTTLKKLFPHMLKALDKKQQVLCEDGANFNSLLGRIMKDRFGPVEKSKWWK
jgi:hypothetical protein